MTQGNTIKTGQEAIDHMVSTWRDLGLGMVNVDFVDPWLKVSRAGADYGCYISVVDGTAVTVIPDEGDRDSDEWVPNDLYPDGLADEEQLAAIQRAFGATSGGSYPLADAGVFCISFNDGDGYKELRIGLLDDTFEIRDS